jgi:hypothetical protein
VVRQEKGRERTLQEIHSTLDEHTAAVDTGGTAESDHKHRTIVSACFVSMLPTGASVAILTGSKCWQKSDRTPQIAKYDRIWDRFCPKKSIQTLQVFLPGGGMAAAMQTAREKVLPPIGNRGAAAGPARPPAGRRSGTNFQKVRLLITPRTPPLHSISSIPRENEFAWR